MTSAQISKIIENDLLKPDSAEKNHCTKPIRKSWWTYRIQLFLVYNIVGQSLLQTGPDISKWGNVMQSGQLLQSETSLITKQGSFALLRSGPR